MNDIIDGTYYDESQTILNTRYKRVLFNKLTEQFMVDLGDDNFCELSGKDMLKNAIRIAAIFEAQ